jgi:NhaA family Na+:H+ antiporter
MPINMLKAFIQLETKSSVLLLAAAFLAIILANSPFGVFYERLIDFSFSFVLPYFSFTTSLKLLVNDGLMTLFFLLISLEVKRGLLIGELNSSKKAALPFIASLGGILAAALVYLVVNLGSLETTKGWAIPTATDIAFSSAVLLLLGRSVPSSLRLLLTTLAIIDDLVAIVIIAVFYSVNFHILFLLLALFCFLTLFVLNKLNITRCYLPLIFALLLWFCILESNISPPLAGVLIGFTLPLKVRGKASLSPLENLEKALHPWVSFGILPLFVFVNGGLSLIKTTPEMFLNPLTLGIMLGLFFGKQLGVFTACWLAVKTKLAKLPDNLSWPHLYGMSILTGIGFTMNLFIGFLAFSNDSEALNLVKLGVFSGSLLSAITGFCLLKRLAKSKS